MNELTVRLEDYFKKNLIHGHFILGTAMMAKWVDKVLGRLSTRYLRTKFTVGSRLQRFPGFLPGSERKRK